MVVNLIFFNVYLKKESIKLLLIIVLKSSDRNQLFV